MNWRQLTSRLAAVDLVGEDLEGFVVNEPAASVRVLLPEESAGPLEMPEWDGNQFLLPDGRRPLIRTFTPRLFDPRRRLLELWVVMHGPGAASEWAREGLVSEEPTLAAVSGPGRGYVVDTEAEGFVLAGDESALAAISQLLLAIAEKIPVTALIEVPKESGSFPLDTHPSTTVRWCELPLGEAPGSSLRDAIRTADIGEQTRVWVAGEARAMQQIRRLLLEDLQLPRRNIAVRGYWKAGERGSAEA